MSIIDLIFPKRCLYCLSNGSYICPKCTKHLKPSLPECYICRRLSNYYKTHPHCNNFEAIDEKRATPPTIINENPLSWATYLWVYNDAASQLMKEAKYNGAYNIFESLGDTISARLQQCKSPLKHDREYIIAPIPQHRTRKFLRGFEHTVLLGDVFTNILADLGYSVRFEKDLLKKSENNKRQASLSKESRLKNSVGVFECDSRLIENEKYVILIDDVITTGATLLSAATTILKDSPNVEVGGIGLFRGRASFKNSL